MTQTSQDQFNPLTLVGHFTAKVEKQSPDGHFEAQLLIGSHGFTSEPQPYPLLLY